MSKKMLSYRDPLINTYTAYGCLFSIMDDNLWPWVYNNFIQIRYADDWGMHVFDCHHMLLKNCPGIQMYNLPHELVTSNWGNSLKNIIIESIDSGFYLHIFVDRFYISQAVQYHTTHFTHDLIIYGYDLDTDTVVVGDNFQNGKFYITECPFHELEKGYSSVPRELSFFSEIRLLTVKYDYGVKIDLDQIAFHLQNYLNSEKTFDLVVEQTFDFGFQAIERLFTDIENAGVHDKELDHRVFHLLYEHKILMEERLRYLMSNEFIVDDKSFLEVSVKLKKDFLILRSLVIKYNINRDPETLKRISSKLRENLHEEKRFITEFIDKVH